MNFILDTMKKTRFTNWRDNPVFEILVNKNNICILKYYDTYYCFSYDKMLASYSKSHEILIYTKNIESETNRKHLKMFKNVLDNMK